MTISYSWLCEYLPLSVNGQAVPGANEMSEILTSIGLEVEHMQHYESIQGGLAGLVVGEILECDKHPDADKLSLTKVNTGDRILQIVCGAPNVRKGQKVIVAPVGSTIYPATGEKVTMKKVKIRGVESEGMICAEDEIGAGESHDGIMILETDAKPGTPASQVLETYSDHIFEIGLTPNRMDAMSHTGVAKDVSAYLAHHRGGEAKPRLPYTPLGISNPSPIDIKIDDTGACKRYAGILIRDIKVHDSPSWIKNRLTAIGVKPVNNIVDITNYVLHETGQPLHAFDAEKIKGNTIVVRRAGNKEKFVTLDQKERELVSSDLVVCNISDPMCLAGIFGGAESGITPGTTSVFLESAWFHPEVTRISSLKHGLRTDAAVRFEKGTDISNVVNALERAASLIITTAGGKIEGFTDVYPSPVEKNQVSFSGSYIKKTSGKHYPAEVIREILTGLGFEFIQDNSEDYTVLVPLNKSDISIPADIAEEILRIDGLNNIPMPENISIVPQAGRNIRARILKEKVAESLSGSGLYEIFTNSISNSELYEGNTIKMLNSLSSELNCMRPDMIHSGLQVIAFNHHRKNMDTRFYEFGKTYFMAGDDYREEQRLSIFLSGDLQPADWKQKTVHADFYALKGIIERIFSILGHQVKIKQADREGFDYGIEYTAGQKCGYAGAISKKLLEKYDIRQPVFAADLNWDILSAPQDIITYSEISRFPSSQRDLAIIIDKEVAFAEVEKATNAARVENLLAVKLFDVFESDKLGEGKKSLALNYTFGSGTNTLTDKEIDSMMNKLIRSYETHLKAEIRK